MPELAQAGLAPDRRTNACDEQSTSFRGAVRSHGVLFGADRVTSQTGRTSDDVAPRTDISVPTILGSSPSARTGGAAAAQIMSLGRQNSTTRVLGRRDR